MPAKRSLALALALLLVAAIPARGASFPAITVVDTIRPGVDSSMALWGKGRLGDYVYFGADDGVNGYELWRTNGTSTTIVADINLSSGSASSPYGFTAFGEWLYFAAADATEGSELWRTNGTTTVLFADINTTGGTGSSDPGGFTALGDWLYFSATQGDGDRELWRTNGTSTNRVTDIYSGVDSSYPRHFTTFGDYLHFTANDGTSIGKTWRVNSAGVVESSVLPGTNAYIDCMCSNAYITLGGRLFAAFGSNETGDELAYFGDPNVGLPETSRDSSAWSVPLALLAALTAVTGVGIRLQRKGRTPN